jgi:hypothetical protein
MHPIHPENFGNKTQLGVLGLFVGLLITSYIVIFLGALRWKFIPAASILIFHVMDVKLIFFLLQIAQMLLNGVCETVARLFNGNCSSYDPSWLIDLLVLFRCYSVVYSAVCSLLCHLITKRSGSLLECHIYGLAAILFHWINSPQCSLATAVLPSSEQIAVANAGSASHQDRNSIAVFVLNSLPMSRREDAQTALRFAVSYLKYATLVSSQSTLQTAAGSSCDVESTRGASSFRDRATERPDMMKHLKAVVPDQIFHIISYTGPRLLVELRSATPVELVSPLSNGPSVISYLSDGFVWNLIKENRLSFEAWVRLELEAENHEDQCDYYNWVIGSCWHCPTSSPRDDDSIDATRLRSFCVELASAILDFDVGVGRRRKVCRCCQPRRNNSEEGTDGNNRAALILLLQVCV